MQVRNFSVFTSYIFYLSIPTTPLLFYSIRESDSILRSIAKLAVTNHYINLLKVNCNVLEVLTFSTILIENRTQNHTSNFVNSALTKEVINEVSSYA